MSSHSPEIRHLSKADRIMKRVIDEIWPYALALRAGRTPFEALARAIAHQQLHGKAAESILNRFVALFPGQQFPRPVDLLATTAELPVDDFAVRNGFRLAYGLDEMPSPKEVWRRGEHWKPFRTAAAWYLWRASESSKLIRRADSMVKQSAKGGADG